MNPWLLEFAIIDQVSLEVTDTHLPLPPDFRGSPAHIWVWNCPYRL